MISEGKFEEMERCITSVTACSTLKMMMPYTSVSRLQCRGIVRSSEQRALTVKCESSHKKREGRRSQRRLNQAASASQVRLASAQTEVELINDVSVDQRISDVIFQLQNQETPLEVLKVTIELCKKEYFVLPKSVAESDVTFCDEEDERLGMKVWFQLVSVDVDPGECTVMIVCPVHVVFLILRSGS